VLSAIGFNLESRGNKLALLVSSQTRDVIESAPAVVQQAHITAGFGEGFLILDRNHNGLIDDASEMFGFATGSGFADLAAYDTNHDCVINASDAVFSQLQMWIDANEDSVTDPGELHSLSELGIASISLNSINLGGSGTRTARR
jgi:hypothetical protein